MKNTLILVIFLLFSTGVFGEDVTVNVMEGDSVTLHTGTEIQTDEIIMWYFGGDVIAKVNSGSSRISVSVKPDGVFRDRLQANNQTGDLKISNIRLTDNGEYKLVISRTNQISKTFKLVSVAVDAVKSVSVMVGDSVSLNAGVTDVQIYEVILWRFEHQNSPIAEMNRTARIVPAYDGPDERFKHRLELDYWTGSLTIMNVGINHCGVYEVDLISSSKHTIHKTFNVTVSGETRTVFMMEGDTVTLHTDLTEIQRDDFILWLFRDTVLAKNYKPDNINKDVRESFRDRLKLDEKSGSLTIRNIKIRDSGLYELKISSRTHSVHNRNIVTVTGEARTMSVMEGESLTLHTDLIKVHTDDVIQWKFEDSPIAEMYKADNRLSTSDESFRDRLSLDEKSGSLTIRNTRTTDSGLYELKINGSRHSVHMKRTVTVTKSGLSSSAVAGIVVPLLFAAVAAAFAVIFYRRKSSMLKRYEVIAISANMKDDVTLRSEKQTPDEIRWMFGDQEILIAKFKRETREFAEYDGPDGRFRDKLRLDDQSGSLTITNTTTEHTGVYRLQTIKSDKVSSKIFSVIVSGNPEEVPLNSVNAY